MRVVHLHGKFLLSEVEILQLPPVEELQEEEGGGGREEDAVNTSQNNEDNTGILMTCCACDVKEPACGTFKRQQEDRENLPVSF